MTSEYVPGSPVESTIGGVSDGTEVVFGPPDGSTVGIVVDGVDLVFGSPVGLEGICIGKDMIKFVQ